MHPEIRAWGAAGRTLLLLVSLCALACEPAPKEPTRVTEISQDELMHEQPGTSLILDVRTPEEFAAGHIAHARNVSHDRIAEALPELQAYASTPIVLYCRSGRRAGLAAEVLAKAGFSDLRHLTGDMQGWEAAGLPVEKGGS